MYDSGSNACSIITVEDLHDLTVSGLLIEDAQSLLKPYILESRSSVPILFSAKIWFYVSSDMQSKNALKQGDAISGISTNFRNTLLSYTSPWA